MKLYYVTIGDTEFKVKIAGDLAEVEGDGVAAVTVQLRSSAPSGVKKQLDAPLTARDVAAVAKPLFVAARGTESMQDGFQLELPIRGVLCEVRVETARARLARRVAVPATHAEPALTRSPLPGVVRKIVAKEGDPIQVGDTILTLEAMKMENDIRAESHGKLAKIFVTEGEVVASGAPLARIE